MTVAEDAPAGRPSDDRPIALFDSHATRPPPWPGPPVRPSLTFRRSRQGHQAGVPGRDRVPGVDRIPPSSPVHDRLRPQVDDPLVERGGLVRAVGGLRSAAASTRQRSRRRSHHVDHRGAGLHALGEVVVAGGPRRRHRGRPRRPLRRATGTRLQLVRKPGRPLASTFEVQCELGGDGVTRHVGRGAPTAHLRPRAGCGAERSTTPGDQSARHQDGHRGDGSPHPVPAVRRRPRASEAGPGAPISTAGLGAGPTRAQAGWPAVAAVVRRGEQVVVGEEGGVRAAARPGVPGLRDVDVIGRGGFATVYRECGSPSTGSSP